ncbi:MAG: LysM peptidoglycan-binding domain-containing protein [Anaerolineae bacterium]|nr:LysM peptidoglycan-binding domain-containing protein [Anaerolineae bacterium]
MRRKSLILLVLVLALLGAASAYAQEDENPTLYTVRAGNTLPQIAEFFNVDLDCLAEGNNITPSAPVVPGQQLTISTSCPPYAAMADQGGGSDASEMMDQGGGTAATGNRVAVNGVYVVQRGDKLALIARDNNASLTCLVYANNIFNPDLIYVGQTIYVPDDCSAYDQGGGDPGTTLPGGGRQVVLETQLGRKVYTLQADGSYIVRPGDILDFIALAFNVDTQCLANGNQLTNPSRLQPGQSLLITSGCPPWSGLPGPTRRYVQAVG